MDLLTTDIWSHVLPLLNDKSKMRLLMTSNDIVSKIKSIIFFNERISIDKIMKSYYFHRFISLEMGKYMLYTSSKNTGYYNQPWILPENAKMMHLNLNRNESNDDCNIPSSVTHLRVQLIVYHHF